MKPRSHPALRGLEVLEPRLAPAVVIAANGHSASYTDVDGDKVTVAVSSGALTAGLFTTAASGAGEQLRTVDLSGGGFDGANLTFSVAKVPGGDGLANIGYINSTGHDLGAVIVKGDLGQIDAGSGSATVPAIRSLAVNSLGRLGTDTQSAGGSLQTEINGALGSLKVTGDIKEAIFSVTDSGGTNGKIGPVRIGGSLIGGVANNSGSITARDGFGSVKINGDIVGGSGQVSGVIACTTDLADVTVGGSLIGGVAASSGEIFSAFGAVGTVKIAGNIEGGTNVFTGRIVAQTTLAGVTIGGSLVGGSGNDSGEIFSGGDMGAVKIGHGVQGGSGNGSGLINSGGKLVSVTIGGSLIGGSAMTSVFTAGSGEIFSTSDMGLVKIGHDVQGGPGSVSGHIGTGGKLAGVSIGGSLNGGSNESSGAITSEGTMGAVKIGHDIEGGSGFGSGFVQSGGLLESVNIAGSLIGGSNQTSGGIFSTGNMGAVKIGHDLTGGSITGSAALDRSGLIESAGRIASVTLGGSIVSGIDTSSGVLTRNATIRAGNDIGALTVKGGLIGNRLGDDSPVIISARGQEFPLPGVDLAIGRIVVGGRVEFANIFAGYDTSEDPVNGDAQIGTVTVGGDWAASNLVAGAMNAASGNTNFGDGNDASIGTGSASIIAKIASITIAGQVFGTPNSTSTTDHFGFVAQQIGALKIVGNKIALASGADNDNLKVGETTDLTVHEI